MIKGKQVTQKVYLDRPTMNYRKLDALNQSMLKLFDNDPVKFFEEFKMGKKRKENKVNTALIIGDLVDFHVLACRGDDLEFENRFDEKFALFEGNKTTAQAFVLADHLFDVTEEHTNDKGVVTTSFEVRFQEAFRRSQDAGKYKGKDIAAALEDFDSKASEYFEKRMEYLGKTVVDISLISKAKTVASGLLNDSFTKKLFTCCDDKGSEYFTHFPIQFEYEVGEKGHITCKAEVDMMFIDYKREIIYIKDLKTTYDNESFNTNYVKNAYYLQNAFYHKAVTVWAASEGMGHFKVTPMEFVVGDTSSANRRPLRYKTSEDDVEKGMNGFWLKGVYHRGVSDLITDIAWAEKNDMWTCSREAFNNDGKMKLDIRYDDKSQ